MLQSTSDIKKLISLHTRRLQKLKETQAVQGVSVEPKILLEIEDIEDKLYKLSLELHEQKNLGRLQKSIKLIRSGKKQEAKKFLLRIVDQTPEFEQAWIWLIDTADTNLEKIHYLEELLKCNPNNEIATRYYSKLKPTKNRKGLTAKIYRKKQEKNDTSLLNLENVSQYFVGHQLSSEKIEKLRVVISEIFDPLGYRPYYADRVIEGHSLLLKICKKIFLTDFSIFDLSEENPNVYLELGIALGLNRPIVAIAGNNASLPAFLQKLNIIRYEDYSSLTTKLLEMWVNKSPLEQKYPQDYCYLCDKLCVSMSTTPDENTFLVLNNSKLLWHDLIEILVPYFAQYHLEPIYLTDKSHKELICDIRRKVLSAQFAICHFDLSNSMSFLGLGIAIGSQMPWLLLASVGDSKIPSNLQGFDRFEYQNLKYLQDNLNTITSFLSYVIPARVPRLHGTHLLATLPFWTRFGNWIDSIKHSTQNLENLQGNIRMVQCDGKRYLSKYIIPHKGLLFGRSSDCDIVIDNVAVSSHHFRILKGKNNQCFIEDLNSMNGTWLNGNRLLPDRQEVIHFDDSIRIAGGFFIVWDERPLPEEGCIQSTNDVSRLVSTIPKIEFPDIAPPSYLKTWDHWCRLVVLHPNGNKKLEFEIQAYYPMGRVLLKLVEILDLPPKKYFFAFRGNLISENETPLSLNIRSNTTLEMVSYE